MGYLFDLPYSRRRRAGIQLLGDMLSYLPDFHIHGRTGRKLLDAILLQIASFGYTVLLASSLALLPGCYRSLLDVH